MQGEAALPKIDPDVEKSKGIVEVNTDPESESSAEGLQDESIWLDDLQSSIIQDEQKKPVAKRPAPSPRKKKIETGASTAEKELLSLLNISPAPPASIQKSPRKLRVPRTPRRGNSVGDASIQSSRSRSRGPRHDVDDSNDNEASDNLHRSRRGRRPDLASSQSSTQRSMSSSIRHSSTSIQRGRSRRSLSRGGDPDSHDKRRGHSHSRKTASRSPRPEAAKVQGSSRGQRRTSSRTRKSRLANNSSFVKSAASMGVSSISCQGSTRRPGFRRSSSARTSRDDPHERSSPRQGNSGNHGRYRKQRSLSPTRRKEIDGEAGEDVRGRRRSGSQDGRHKNRSGSRSKSRHRSRSLSRGANRRSHRSSTKLESKQCISQEIPT